MTIIFTFGFVRKVFTILSDMLEKKITFDRFIRGIMFILLLVGGCLLLRYLSGVLIPFFVAWFIAYLLYPIVTFLQHRCRLRYRILCIFLTLAIVGGSIGTLVYFSVPPFVKECLHIKDVALEYIERGADNTSIPEAIHSFFREYVNREELGKMLRAENIAIAVKNAAPKVWEVLWSTANVLISLISSLIALLYLFFLLNDYEKYSKGWMDYVPKSRREMMKKLVGDVEVGMSGYFRGQMLIALSNCVMFTLGFYLIGFPAPLGLGCFIGVISFVPYLQLLGLLPATVLALLHATETDANFWWLIGGVILVYCVVQIIQDALVTPKVMGKIMGLSPAIVLLALSVWGYMLGVIGLIIALPATTLLISYYRNFLEREGESL